MNKSQSAITPISEYVYLGPLADAFLFMVRGCDAPVTTLISEGLSFLTQWQCRSLQFRIHCRLVDQY